MKKRRNYILIIGLTLLLIAFVFADLLFGSAHIEFSDFLNTIFGKNENLILHEIIINYRLPKAITAILAGAALSVAGLLLQTLFRNPLADPYILGVSSGASLGVAVVVMSATLVPAAFVQSGWTQIFAAVAGAAVVLTAVVAVSYKVRDVVSLLIVGIMFGTISASLVTVLQNASNPDILKIFINWTFGSLVVSWTYLLVLLPVIIIGIIAAFLIQKPLDGMLLGERYAESIGISVKKERLIIVLITGVLAGGITAFTGPIAFVGVAVPHLARGIFRTSEHRILLTASVLCGAILLLACDIITQIPANPLPVNTVSALLGAPIIIWILIKK
ncbi:MAG: iron ABC transporter permease [Paludibacter sp.]|nr:iron ABC transporter permease [Paludibacter sp.]